MARASASNLPSTISWICRQCRTQNGTRSRVPASRPWLQQKSLCRNFSTSRTSSAQVEVRPATEIDFEDVTGQPARILPASPSYFTASPNFTDHLLLLQSLVKKHSALPTAPPDQTPRSVWLKLNQYRTTTGEQVAASKFTKLQSLLMRLNRIHPKIMPNEVKQTLRQFRRPGTEAVQQAKPQHIDEFGRSIGIGRRKTSTAKVYLVEGTGAVMVNGRSVVDVFPRLHDRESALWALKITQRMDKYNVFAMISGGGVTGQAEAFTLALARALLVHEPALKPALRRAGCVTADPRRVERKKPGRLKARKRPTWVKR